YDGDGAPVAPSLLSWRSLDTTVATVDSTGRLAPRRAGAVTVEASAGGWRWAQQRVQVRPREFTVVLAEDWRRGIGSRWRRFGTPSPDTVSDAALGHAMWNRGDSSAVSGIRATQALDVTRGV